MLVLKVLGALCVILVVLAAAGRLEHHALQRYNHRFFSRAIIRASALAVGLCYLGLGWYRSSAASGGDQLNGIILIVLGLFVLVGLVVWHVHRTRFLIGLSGSALSIGVFAPIGLFGYAVLFAFLALMGFVVLAALLAALR